MRSKVFERILTETPDVITKKVKIYSKNYSKMKNQIDKVTVTNLDIALRMVGITMDKETIDKIIDIIELLENKGNDTSIKDICDLQAEWKQ